MGLLGSNTTLKVTKHAKDRFEQRGPNGVDIEEYLSEIREKPKGYFKWGGKTKFGTEIKDLWFCFKKLDDSNYILTTVLPIAPPKFRLGGKSNRKR